LDQSSSDTRQKPNISFVCIVYHGAPRTDAVKLGAVNGGDEHDDQKNRAANPYDRSHDVKPDLQ
jgi:hypothetical protein